MLTGRKLFIPEMMSLKSQTCTESHHWMRLDNPEQESTLSWSNYWEKNDVRDDLKWAVAKFQERMGKIAYKF